MAATDIGVFGRTADYLKFIYKSGNEHSVHSPFVFKLLTESLYDKSPVAGTGKIEALRKKLLGDQREINTVDLGAGSTYDGKSRKRSVAKIASRFAKSLKYCKSLYHFTNHFKPPVMIELGTSLGISAMYQQSGNPGGKLYTLEGCPETARIAKENFINNGFEKIECITGNFDDTLPALLNKIGTTDYCFIDGNHTYDATLRYFNLLKKHMPETGMIIFDDINWSTGMKKAWDEIRSDPDLTVSIDFYFLGIVFFNKKLFKQNFILRL